MHMGSSLGENVSTWPNAFLNIEHTYCSPQIAMFEVSIGQTEPAMWPVSLIADTFQ